MHAAAASSTPRVRPPISRKKRFLFGILMIAGTYLAVELIAFCAIYFVFDGWSEVQRVAEGDTVPDSLESGFDFADEIVHPYLGWVRRPHATTGATNELTAVNDYGFPGRDTPLRPANSDTMIIGILGGSLAEQFSVSTLDILKEELTESPALREKELVFVRLSLSGYKQPQQLLVVNYLLTLGARFDILINIDGYNEVVLPAVENVPNRVFDGYPRSWNLRTANAGDMAVIRSIGRIAHFKDRANHWANVIRDWPWRYSATLNLVWRLYRENLRLSMFNEYAHLRQMKFAEWNFASCGPPQEFAADTDLYSHCARIWMRSSLQLHQLSAANGIRYYHFLQPNQYVPGSKSMGSQETSEAWARGHRGQHSVETGYPLLTNEGRHLIQQGVSFTDLTMLFVDHPEQTYRDVCCHLNGRGNELMARRIAEVIRSTYPGD